MEFAKMAFDQMDLQGSGSGHTRLMMKTATGCLMMSFVFDLELLESIWIQH